MNQYMYSMWFVEIYDKHDFCSVTKRFLCKTESHANYMAGVWVSKLADECEDYKDFPNMYDYRIIEVEIFDK